MMRWIPMLLLLTTAAQAQELQILSGQSPEAKLDWAQVGRCVPGGNRPSYTFVGRSASDLEVKKCDPETKALRDGGTGPGSWVFTRWGGQHLETLWDLGGNYRVEAVVIFARHPNTNSHPDEVTLTGLPDTNHEGFEPDARFEVPFQEGGTQVIRLSAKDPVVGRFMKVHLRSYRSQCAIDEIVLLGRPTEEASRPRKSEAAVSIAPAPLAKIPPLEFNRGLFGMCGHMIHCAPFMGHFGNNWQLDYTLPLGTQAGASWYREPLYLTLFYDKEGKPRQVQWAELDRLMGLYRQARARVILAPMIAASPEAHPLSARFVTELARRYGDFCKVIELHNEPNLLSFWRGGDPDAYFRACKAIYPAVKAARPDVKFIVGSYSGFGADHRYGDVWARRPKECPYATEEEMLVGYHKRLLALGVTDYCDGFSFHPYRSGSPESGTWIGRGDVVNGFEREMKAFLALTQNAGKPLEYYITEVGYNSAPFGQRALGSEDAQARYYARLMVLLFDMTTRGAPIKAVCWYDLKCDGTDTYDDEHNYGLVSHSTLRRRKAWNYARVLNGLLRDPADYKPVDAPRLSRFPEATKSYAWRLKDGSLLCAFWRLEGLSRADFDAELTLPGAAPANVSLVDLDSPGECLVGYRRAGDAFVVPVHVQDRPTFLRVVPENR